MSSNFQGDLSEEKRCIKYLKARPFFDNLFEEIHVDSKVINVEIKEGNFKFYDVELKFRHPIDGDFSETIEIKLDKACAKWGNILIEYESRKQPSGIEVTSSSYWLDILFSKDEPGKVRFGLIPTQSLKDLIANSIKTPVAGFRTGAKCGDWDNAYGGNVARGHAISESLFLSKCVVTGYLDMQNFVKGADIRPYDPGKYTDKNTNKRNFPW